MAYTPPSGYRDRFNPLLNYQKLLFIEGAGLQASELNELQDSIRNDLSLIAQYLVANGTVISGGTVSALIAKSMSLTQASVIVNGHVVQVPASTVTIAGTGTELVGVAYITNLISYINDPTLVELDSASPIVGQSTSYREQAAGRWSLSTGLLAGETFFPIYTLNNGQIVSTSTSTTNAVNNALIAYDRETRGSATLNGLGVTYAYTSASGNPVLNISSGKARVLGNPVVVPYTQQTSLAPISDTSSVAGETLAYTGNNTYNLAFYPIQAISTVQGTKQVTTTVTHGTYNTAVDLLPNTAVLQLISVTQGGTTFAIQAAGGTTGDCKLNGSSVDWSINSSTKQPSPGSTYTVTYNYIASFIPAISANGLGLVLDSTNTLVSGTTFAVTYSYYLSRIDRLSIDVNGNYIVTKGTPGYINYYPQPYLSSALSLATISLTYGVTPVVTIDTISNLTVYQWDQLQAQVQNNSLAIATLSLQQNATAQQPTSTKRGVFVDNLASNAQQDAGQTNTAILLPDTSNTLSTSGLSLALPSNLNILGTTAAWVYLPYTQQVVQSQTSITGTRAINPYSSQTTTILQPRVVMNPPIKYGNELWYWFHGNFLPYNTVVQALVSGFQPGETVNVYIGSGNILNYTAVTGSVFVDTINLGYYTSSSVATASGVADSTGSATISMTISAGTVNGVYLVSAAGLTSGVAATTTFSIFVSPDRLSGDYYIPITNPVAYGYDPLAETFQLSTTYDLTYVGLYVGAAPADDLRVRIVDAKYGIPDTTTLLADGLVKKSAFTQGSTNVGWVNVPLTNPATAVANSEYAITVLTSTAVGSVGTAVMGYTDVNTKQLVSSQPAAGVLQTSSNYSTWTPIQNEDMSYILYAAKYQAGTPVTTVLVTAKNCVSLTDWFISGTVVTPAGTSCRFFLTDGNGNQYTITPNQPLYTQPLSGTVTLSCTMNSTNSNVSPKIQVGLELLGGTTSAATYTSRAFTVPNGTVQSATLFLVADVVNPSLATINVQFQNNSATTPTYGTASQTGSAVPIGNGWYTATWATTTAVSVNSTRLRINLSTTDATQRPKLQNLRVLIV